MTKKPSQSMFRSFFLRLKSWRTETMLFKLEVIIPLVVAIAAIVFVAIKVFPFGQLATDKSLEPDGYYRVRVVWAELDARDPAIQELDGSDDAPDVKYVIRQDDRILHESATIEDQHFPEWKENKISITDLDTVPQSAGLLADMQGGITIEFYDDDLMSYSDLIETFDIAFSDLKIGDNEIKGEHVRTFCIEVTPGHDQ